MSWCMPLPFIKYHRWFATNLFVAVGLISQNCFLCGKSETINLSSHTACPYSVPLTTLASGSWCKDLVKIERQLNINIYSFVIENNKNNNIKYNKKKILNGRKGLEEILEMLIFVSAGWRGVSVFDWQQFSGCESAGGPRQVPKFPQS